MSTHEQRALLPASALESPLDWRLYYVLCLFQANAALPVISPHPQEASE